eukprot:g5698.t1
MDNVGALELQFDSEEAKAVRKSAKNSKAANETLLAMLDLCWLRRRENYPFNAHAKMNGIKLVNHIAGEEALTRKDQLAFHLQRNNIRNVHPSTVGIDEWKLSGMEFDALFGKDKNRAMIIKPANGSCGRGIMIFPVHDQHSFVKALETYRGKYTTEQKVVCQRYLNHPLLFRYRKFDLRVYLLIVQMEPEIVAYYHDGYMRVCGTSYTKENFGDATQHISNWHINSSQGGSRESWETFHDFLIQNEVDCSVLREKMKKSILTSVRSAKSILLKNWAQGQFALLGVDFVIDSQGHPWLIEFTKSAGIRGDVKWLELQNRSIISGTLDIMRSAREYWETEVKHTSLSTHLSDQDSVGSFHLLT